VSETACTCEALAPLRPQRPSTAPWHAEQCKRTCQGRREGRGEVPTVGAVPPRLSLLLFSSSLVFLLPFGPPLSSALHRFGPRGHRAAPRPAPLPFAAAVPWPTTRDGYATLRHPGQDATARRQRHAGNGGGREKNTRGGEGSGTSLHTSSPRATRSFVHPRGSFPTSCSLLVVAWCRASQHHERTSRRTAGI